jgi:Ca-activated chloride channel family protein
LAVGTVQGAPIPSGDGFVSDKNGNIVVARLQRDELLSIATAGGGKYSELTTGSTAISPWAAVEGGEFALQDDALGERWKDAGPWLLLLLLPVVAFSFRRGLLFVLPLLVLPGLLISTDAKAGLWQNLWSSKDQQAQIALLEDRAADAALLAQDPAIAGEALYRSGEFVEAGQRWSQSNQVDVHYNRGNAMAQAGEFEAALAAYQAALEQEPEMEDAIFNRDLVEQLQQEKEQQEQEDSEGESSDQESDQESEEGEQGDEQSSENQQDGEQSEEESEQQSEGEESAEPSESEMEQNWSEEDAQAMEQWLRRIPDDPGGLLRRKFRNQHQRRGAPADESETW